MVFISLSQNNYEISISIIHKKNSYFVAVLVKPDEDILEKIKHLPFDYYQIYVKDNILYINDNVNNVFNINLNDQSLFKKLNILVTEISKLYNKDN